MKTLLCNQEAARLKALHQYHILDTSPEQVFDDLVFLAAQTCAAPIAIINFVDAQRQWFKAKVGIDVQEMPIVGFCPICVHKGQVLIIPDTLADEEFAHSPVVTGEPFVRFYAGIPLIVGSEQAIGTLCVVDRVPREINDQQVEALLAISRLIVKQIELRQDISVIAQDITQKQQLENQFLRAQRMESIGTLASGIAHDLNNVLSPILMSVQLLQSTYRDQRSSQILKILENNAKRGANLVKQVLSFARGMEGDRTVIQIKHLILEMKQIIEQTFPKSIVISTEIQSNLWHVSGDSTQLHQVLMNLCLNARDAMPKSGHLQIAAHNIDIDEHYAKMHIEAKVGSYIVLSISDTGLGIKNELIDRIFEPFFTTKEFGKGTGLGLSTVMGIVKGHGGFITVSSILNQGTTFKVFLPAVLTATTQQVEELENKSGYGEWILVVDDEPAVRDITQASLEDNNYKAITASDGIEALAIYAQNKDKISAAIIDMMMPTMDGATTISTLQKMNPRLSIIAVSGLTTSEQLPINQKSGVTAFLPKPYTAQELLKTLHTVINSTVHK
ncbi:response regulator [Iningainema sp. BLCCT55]|uniref:histidine kinase n=1 Tax=Iningainema tapete BLCC-T55 TaxID=2748662 RepID=A0A8J6XDZ1_9CYAN|nr:ATP-binding protein [Iningainema tapete]MBD2774485.1 response regulator [Iningainema tapete BLCC-T55]